MLQAQGRTAGLATALAALALAVLTLPASLHAQSVRGRLVEAGSNRPVGGALVQLLDADDAAVARALTDEGGRFVLEAPRAGAYRVRAERIGYRDWTSGPMRLEVGSDVARVFEMQAEAVALEALEVEADRECRVRPEEGRRAGLLWEEVRKALRATALGDASRIFEYRIRRYERQLAPDGNRVRNEESSTTTGRLSQPFMTMAADRLVEDGFVQGQEVGSRIYFAPTAETLVADAFLDTHCLRVAEPRTEDGRRLAGLQFEPVSDRDVPDVAGTLWVDVATGELRRMEFHYVNIELPEHTNRDQGVPGARRSVSQSDIGGELRFLRLPTGEWIIRQWRIRTPEMEMARAWWDRDRRQALQLTGLQETGREILEIRRPDGTRIFDLEQASLAGTVVDSTRSAPLSDAVVRLEGTPYADTTGDDGTYRLTGLPEGEYAVTISHARLDTVGAAAPRALVELVAGEAERRDLAIPSWTTVLASRCPEGAPAEAAFLGGFVRDRTTDVPLQGATVRLVTVETGADGSPAAGEVLAETRSGEAGTYAFCNVRAEGPARLRVSYLGTAEGSRRVELAAGGRKHVDVTLEVTRPAVVAGRVVGSESGEPVSGARISLGQGSGERVTGEDGTFRFEDVSPGQAVMRVEHVGYATGVDTLRIASADTVELRLGLASEAVAVAPLTVEVEAGQWDVTELDPRTSLVHEMGPGEIEEMREKVSSMADLLRQMRMAGLTVRRIDLPLGSGNPSGAAGGGTTTVGGEGICVELSRNRSQDIRLGFQQGDYVDCSPVVLYVDGVRISPQQMYTYLLTMDPNNIARIRVIPPAEAGARYGPGSSNGVLVIETRGGQPR